MGYTVLTYTGAEVATVATMAEAVEACRARWGSAAVVGGYSGDLEDGGEQSLVWVDEAHAANDSGYAACGRVVRA